jgi:signal transduction histidine kinase/ActR/RegA family two-component response regulator
VVHADDLSRLDAAIGPALDSGMPWEAEVRFGTPTAGWRYHVARGIPRRDTAGHVVSWVCTSTEMDARVRTERALRILADASKRLGATLEDPPAIEGVLKSLVPLLADAALLDLERDVDRERKQIRIVGERVDKKKFEDPRFDLGPATVRYTQRPEIFLDVAREMATTQSARVDHLRFLHELGVKAYMCLPLASRGHSFGTLTLVRLNAEAPYGDDDATLAQDLANRIAVAIDNARLHEATEHRRQLLEEANRSKDVFLATLSHELRTPLNAIIGWTDMMRNGQLQEGELDRAAETIDRNAHLLASLVADLLDVSRIVTGTLKLDSKLVGIASVVEAAVEAARPQCTAKRVVLDVALERVGCVKGDPARLRQVLGNLLSNALKFTPTGGTITVRLTRDGDRSRISIRDTGEGISTDFLPHVFERFRQAETARARGLGLGLAIVKHLVEEHGGTVSAASEGKGKGAMFSVELPVAAEEATADEERNSLAQPASGPPELVGVNVLVVEDDPDGNELITTILERYGARVVSVGTADAALEALDAATPDVLVSDIGLPDRDGMELIKLVRQRPECERLPAIALTAYASKQDAAKAIAAGFDTHVAKPVQPATLGTAIVRLVEERPVSSRGDEPEEKSEKKANGAPQLSS